MLRTVEFRGEEFPRLPSSRACAQRLYTAGLSLPPRVSRRPCHCETWSELSLNRKVIVVELLCEVICWGNFEDVQFRQRPRPSRRHSGKETLKEACCNSLSRCQSSIHYWWSGYSRQCRSVYELRSIAWVGRRLVAKVGCANAEYSWRAGFTNENA